MALAGQQVLCRSRVRVAITLVVFDRVEQSQTGGKTLVGRVQLGTQLVVHATFGLGVGGLVVVLVGIARRVERCAVGKVERAGICRLIQHTQTLAEQCVRAFVIGSRRCVCHRRVVFALEVVNTQTAQHLPLRCNLHHVLHVQTHGSGVKSATHTEDAQIFIHPITVVGRSDFDVVLDQRARRVVVGKLFMGIVNTCQHLMLDPESLKLLAVIALDIRGLHVLDFVVGAAAQHRRISQRTKQGRLTRGG